MANDVVASGAPTGGLTDNEKMLSALGYVIICCALPLFLVPMLAAKDSKFAQYHARQGAALYIVALAGGIVFYIVTLVLTFGGRAIGVPQIACLGSIIQLLFGGACFVLMIIGAVNAMQGQMKELPGTGPIAAKLPF